VGREEDFELVRRLCSGDAQTVESAFDVLYDKYKGRVFNTAVRILGDRAAAADVTQETFLSVLRKARKFNFRSAFSSWLYRVAVNLCIDARRKRNRRRPLSLSEPEVSAWLERDELDRPVTPGPEQAARSSELRRRVAAAVSRSLSSGTWRGWATKKSRRPWRCRSVP